MRLFLLLVITLLTSLPLLAQKRDRQALEREKKKNIEQLNELREVLKKTSSEKQVSIGQLKALTAQIDAQSRQINLLSDEIKLSGNFRPSQSKSGPEPGPRQTPC